ncbi:MAG: ROK family transcriptional regulator [Actinomycetia bacterium]|nr:ROK family transcriptional regulator [Actinomycetes bacterium]
MAKNRDTGRGGPGVRGPINGCIVSLVGSGRATTRIALARALGLTPSTISFHVNQLLAENVLFDAEVGTEVYNKAGRGRPARRLRLTGDGSATLTMDLGADQARLALLSVLGEVMAQEMVELDLTDPPQAILSMLAERAEALIAKADSNCTVRAIGVAVPGPVDITTGTVVLSTRMPGWAGFAVRNWLEQRFDVPVAVENDSNAMAYGEYLSRPNGRSSTVTVKADSSLGAGIILGGRVHRGASYGAGEITHVRIPQGGERPCVCGNVGCLETVASGQALVAALQELGIEVSTTEDVVALAQAGQPEVNSVARAAGTALGQVLCTVTNVINPQAIYLGGALATIEPFVAAVRSQIYQGSHPITTQNLMIERARSGKDGVLLGMSHLAFEAGWDRASASDEIMNDDD